MFWLRWQLFKLLSAIGWWICPEPYRSEIRARFNVQWHEVEDE